MDESYLVVYVYMFMYKRKARGQVNRGTVTIEGVHVPVNILWFYLILHKNLDAW